MKLIDLTIRKYELEHWKYMAMRNIYGRSRLRTILRAVKLYVLWHWHRNSNERMVVTCGHCLEDWKLEKRAFYYYQNTKCGRCYL